MKGIKPLNCVYRGANPSNMVAGVRARDAELTKGAAVRQNGFGRIEEQPNELTDRRNVTILPACSDDEVSEARALFTQYAKEIQVDLFFQNFQQELAGLPGSYAPPEGRLLIARICPDQNQDSVPGNGEANEISRAPCSYELVGCVALRKLGPQTCEMKRLYVRPAFRGQRIGRLLAEAIINAARQIGYQRMRLDTLSSFIASISLYRSLGFNTIPAYYRNPCSDPVFLELVL